MSKYIKVLLTSFARSVRESIYLRFSYRPSEKTEGKYFPVQTEQTRLIRHLLYGLYYYIYYVAYAHAQAISDDVDALNRLYNYYRGYFIPNLVSTS